jgi:NAD(P)-dependent dehydrogenase (short-subunit alcohol dehydrogenase family)
MALRFDGDVVVITGAARGMGRTHALLLAALGARVVVNDLGGTKEGGTGDSSAAKAVVQEITAAGGTAMADTHDGSTATGAQSMIDHVIDRFGRVDAVVANAGILRDASFHKMSDADFFAVLHVHLGGTVRVFQAAYRRMREQGYGRLVSTTSAAGLFGNFGQTNYGSAKMGIVGLTRSLAQEIGKHDIRINTIAPGAKTRMSEDMLANAGPLGDLLKPELVSPFVAYLCHRSATPNGQVFSVAGGRIARVAMGVTGGALLSDPSIDSVAAAMGGVMARDDFVFPNNVFDEVKLMAQDLGGKP